ncbi:MAG: ABC transporter permease [Candidatus Lustribacter sp.]|jgi:peptide/nickel transport system permease protein
MRTVRRFLRERSAVAGASFVIVLVLAAVIGPFLDAIPPNVIDHALIGFPQPPSAAHWLGTDLIGRDEFIRALYGARVSLLVGASAMLVSFAIGIFYGAIAGAASGAVDNLMMRFVDAMLSFPTFFLLLIVAALTEKFSLSIIILIIGLTSWPGLARLVRAEVLSLRERDFVEAARALGASPLRLVVRHLIPNALAPVVVAAAFAIGDNILAESSLSFFGLGVQPPAPSWGNMLQDALTPQAEAAPWMVLVPGLGIVATVLAFSVIADGIRVALDTSIGQETGDADVEEVGPYNPVPAPAS